MQVSAASSIDISCSPERAYDFVTSLEAPALTFEGEGRIPGVKRTEVVGGGPLREGAVCQVHGTDGAVMERLITVMDRPRRHEYRLASGFKRPLSWLVRSGLGQWTFTPTPSGGARVEWIYVFELTSPLSYPFVRFIIIRLFHKAMVKCLQRTKELLSSPNAP
jgi:hypothetical protein